MLCKRILGTAAGLLLVLGGGGCSQQTLDSAQKDAARNVSAVNQQAKKVAREARPQLDKLGMGGRVTAALQASKNLPHTIRVDAGTQGVRLRGTVRTRAQKELAGRIARDTLPADKSVENQLEVSGP